MSKKHVEKQVDEESDANQPVPDCFKVRYASEAADMEFLQEKYKVKTYLDVVAAKDRGIVLQLLDPTLKLSTPLFPQFFPRLYRAAGRTLDRLGLAGPISVYLLTDGKEITPFAYYLNDEDGLQFYFFVSSSDIENLADDELAFFFGSKLAHWFYGIDYLMGLEKDSEDGEPDEQESVLKQMGNEIYRKWVIKSQVSEDRVGALAAGGFEPAARALMKRKYGVSSQHLVIPRMSELDGIGEATASDMPIYNHLPFRLKALRLFCEDWFSPSRESCSLVAVDEAIDALFAKSMRYPDNKSAEVCMFLIADMGLELLALDDEPTDNEIRQLVSLILDFTEKPRGVFLMDKKARATRMEESIAYVMENEYEGGRILRGAIQGLAEFALWSGITAEEKLDHLRAWVLSICGDVEISDDEMDDGGETGGDDERQRPYFGIDVEKMKLEMRAKGLLEIIDNIRLNADNAFSVDPVMDNLVARAQKAIEGRPYKDLKPPKGKANDAEDGSMAALRYAGDYESERMLKDVYHVDDYLRKCTEVARQKESSTQSVGTCQGAWLTPSLSPRLFNVLEKVTKNLKFGGSFKVLCVNSPELNACAWWEPTPEGDQGYIKIHSATLESLDDGELAFVLGHEIGHLIFNHSEAGSLRFWRNEGGEDVYYTKLPLMGDLLYREWEQKGEISADRMGVVASQDLQASLRALVKVAYGLTEKNLDTTKTVDELLQQLENVKDKEILDDANLRSHPLDQIRLKAMQLFGEAYFNSPHPDLKNVDKEIGEYFKWLRKKPRTKAETAKMQLFATAGISLVEQDGAVEEREIREILDTLVCCFTEDPIEAIIVDRRERNSVYQSIANELYYVDDADKKHVMRLLVHLALSDGSISAKEQKFLARVAEKISCDFDFKSIEEEVVQTIRLPVDFLLEDIVKELREVISPKEKSNKR